MHTLPDLQTLLHQQQRTAKMQRHIVTAHIINQGRSTKARKALSKVDTKTVHKRREVLAADGPESLMSIIDHEPADDADRRPEPAAFCANAQGDNQKNAEGEVSCVEAVDPDPRW
jgi:hypothetical protein